MAKQIVQNNKSKGKVVIYKSKLKDGQNKELFDIISEYSATLELLEKYDTGKLVLQKTKKAKFVLTYDDANRIISNF